MATAQTMRELREQKKLDGLSRVEVWVPKGDEYPVKTYAKELCKRAAYRLTNGKEDQWL